MALITNEWDRDNLMFLLTSDDVILKHWYAQADADDLMYAQQLMASYAEELRLRAELAIVEDNLTQMEKFPEVTDVLNRIKVMK
jgi:vacuolar-type H+-ATPase subunit B/Vma2